MFNKLFYEKSCFFKITWENVVEPDGPQVYVHYILDN
jgi:hypothetical protein